jgi:hypothetical protein
MAELASCLFGWCVPAGRRPRPASLFPGLPAHTRSGDQVSLSSGQTAPDAVRLAGGEAVGTTFRDNRAAPADRLGSGLASGSGRSAFPFGMKENFAIHTPAGRVELPVPRRCLGLGRLPWAMAADVSHDRCLPSLRPVADRRLRAAASLAAGSPISQVRPIRTARPAWPNRCCARSPWAHCRRHRRSPLWHVATRRQGPERYPPPEDRTSAGPP